MSDTPAGAVACCPSENLEKWGSSTGSLSLAPGKSKSEVYYSSTPGLGQAGLEFGSDFEPWQSSLSVLLLLSSLVFFSLLGFGKARIVADMSSIPRKHW